MPTRPLPGALTDQLSGLRKILLWFAHRSAGQLGESPDDLASELTLRVIEALRGYDPARPLIPYAATVARNHIRRRLRDHKRRSKYHSPHPLHARDGARNAPRRDLDLQRLLVELPARDQMILRMIYAEGYSQAEIAAKLGYACRETVSQRVRILRTRIRKQL